MPIRAACVRRRRCVSGSIRYRLSRPRYADRFVLKGGLLRAWEGPQKSVVAEKFQAMIALGEVNSRFKDFYDVWFLSQHFDFDASVLSSAVRATFTRRGTELPHLPLPLAEAFANDEPRQTQWRAFLRRSLIENAPPRFADVVAVLRVFLQPLLDAMHDGTAALDLGSWRAAQGWSRYAGT